MSHLSLKKSKSAIFFYLCSIICWISSGYAQQVQIKGSVRDSLENELVGAQLILYNKSDSSIASFTITSVTGQYSMSFADVPITEVFLEASFLGYIKQTKIITDSIQNGNSFNVDFVLKEDVLRLKDLVIEGQKPIKFETDTITYRLSEFANSADDVLEDALEKLPGINVSSTGKISYKGKEISKILLDGDDLTSSNYQLISKNLTSDLVEEIEILKNYTDSRLLRGLKSTDEIAINLKLKSGRTAPLFGNVNSGIGIDEVYDLRTDLLTYQKKVKGIFFGNLNNVGDDPIGSDFQKFNSGSFTSDYAVLSSEIVSEKTNLPSYLSKDRMRFNGAKYGSLNFIYAPNKTTSVRLISSAYSDKIRFTKSSLLAYNIGTAEVIEFQTRTFQKESPENYYTDITFNKQIDDNTDISLRATLNKDISGLKSTNILNVDTIPSVKSNDSDLATLRILYERKLAKNIVTEVDAFVIKDDSFEDFSVDNNSLARVLNLSEDNAVKQVFLKDFYNMGILSTTSGYWNNFELSAKVAYIFSQQKLVNIRTGREAFDQKLNEQNLFIETLLKKTFQKITITAGGRIRQNYRKLNQSDEELFIEPMIGLTARMGKKSKFDIIYTSENSYAPLNTLIPEPSLIDFRSIYQSTIQFNEFQNYNTAVLSYKYENKEVNFMSGYVQLLHTNNTPAILNDLSFNENVIGYNIDLARNESQTKATCYIDRYFSSLSTTIKLQYEASEIKIYSRLEENLNKNLLRNQRIKLSTGTTFKNAFNFGLSMEMNRMNNLASIENSSFSYLNFRQKTTYDHSSNRLSANLTIDLFKFYSNGLSNSEPTILMDFELRYKLISNKLNLGIDANNILDRTSLDIVSIDALSSSKSSYSLLGRYVMIKANLRI